ncbi:alanine--tRNA ligase [Blastopirellula sp. JC732]|uniref:Alanine--tRNA ligase n=1 Tax=Blastopirellula sediminis TaxID=2894196 RepID=A0A9X1MPK1_9BACT|nr:alanine--tRNA ligase [Blastopirellula sediminis]MCC9605702.1 alanine--tRNA ligase [Blastopirellula sediminis]MCC9630998.1 alanine--tRNA ligase [Blastopirellula sediminis]
MKTDELREKYLSFFETKGHARRASDVLVPTWDPSVLFTPAGMNQFKDHFLGRVKLDFTRATTCQKCLRTGDIDNVGRTAYHHTFFEMLGNFSFGDYFKAEAITWAWEFLTDKKWLGLPADQLSVTVYKDDDEAADYWHEKIGLPTARIQRLEEDENFWPASAPSQGPDGVCGPCSEIYFHPKGSKPVEIWNLVFTQFNRVGDPPNNLEPLPSKNIDTGMGLERTAATLQGVTTNYHIDILRPIVEAAAEICGVKYVPEEDNGRRLRRITDHIRACTFAIHENVYPGANKEKYVIRRLLRRAVLDGHQMGLREPFAYQLVDKIAEMMKVPYPELQETTQRVANVIKTEEANFLDRLDEGLARTEKVFATMRKENLTVVNGVEAAELYQTYGFPPELFEQVAAEKGLTFDWPGYKEEMEKFGEATGRDTIELFGSGPIESLKNTLRKTDFVGYDQSDADVTIKGIVANDEDGTTKLVDDYDQLGAEHELIVVTDCTPFYGESGGQVGDTGEIVGEDFLFIVTDTQKDSDLFLHRGYLANGKISSNTDARAVVSQRRCGVQRAHSATHILHYALQKHLGEHAQQQGSKVDEDWLRFDFSNMSAVTPEQLAAIEEDVNERVAAGETVKWETVPLAKARELGAMMLFGEKYPDPVRLVSMGTFSRELCGGTHLTNTSQVGMFEVISEEGPSAGVRRIVALTGERAKQYREQVESALGGIAKSLGVHMLDVPEAIKQLLQYVRDLKKAAGGSGKAPEALAAISTNAKAAAPDYTQQKETLKESARMVNVGMFDAEARVAALLADVESLKKDIAARAEMGVLTADDLLAKAETVGSTKLIVAEAPGAGPNEMRGLIDQLRKKAAPCAVLLIAAQGEDKVMMVAGLSEDVVKSGGKAGEWVKAISTIVGGSGGGRPDMAQAGGKEPGKIADALVEAIAFGKKMLG